MLYRLDHRASHYALLLLTGTALFLVNLGGPSLWDVDEGRNAGCALEMVESGDYLKPTFNAELRVDKPPLLYWLEAVAYHYFGVNEFAARLPSALAALATVLLTYELGRSLFGQRTGLLAGLVFAMTPLVCASARFANPDALLNLFTVLPLLVFWLGYKHTGRYLFVPVSLGMALAVLAKGPVGLALPVLVLTAFLIWERRLRLLWSPRLLLGVLVFGLVALPWYALVGAETKGEFLRGFLLTHNLGRFRSTMENHSGGPFYYLLVVLVGFAPWSAFLGLAGWYSRRAANAQSEVRNAKQRVQISDFGFPISDLPQRARFLWCWLGVYFLFFTLSATKLPNYVLPMTAPLAVLMASFLERWRLGEVRPPTWAMVGGLVGVALTGLATAAGLILASGAASDWLPKLPRLEGLGPWAFIGLFPLLGAVAAWWCLRRQRYSALIVSLMASAFLFLLPLAAWTIAALNAYKAARPLVAEADARQFTQDIRVASYDLGYLPSLTFYCQRTVKELTGPEQVQDFLRWPVPVYLFVPEPTWRQLQGSLHGPYRVASRRPDLYRRCAVLAITNR
jgi:4-amino-4-deoxy-L-arabinose transferase-like glycosyltransferase